MPGAFEQLPEAVAQATVVAQETGASEIGSTDGIVALGILMVLLVLVPVIVQRLFGTKD